MRAAPSDETLDGLFRTQVAATPLAPAITFRGRTMSYRELDLKVDHLAAVLRAEGVGPEVPVGLCAARGEAMMVGLLGILRAGGAYVPLDPDYPDDRLAYMLTDTAAPLVLTHDGLAGAWTGAVPVHDLDRLPPAIPLTGAEATPDNLAYVIYTSGSTGRPKGVLVPHRCVVNRLTWGQRTLPIGPGTSVLQKTPFSFDVSVWELFWPLVTGARLVLAKPGGHRDPAYLTELIRAEKIDIVHFVPSMLTQFLAEPSVSTLTCVRHLMCSGERLPVEAANRVVELLGAQVHNLYGPTEVTIEMSEHLWRPDPEATTVPIGSAIDNVTMYLLDADFCPVPQGAQGEVFVGGLAVTRGYHGRPDLTADRYLPDPFAGDGTRMYRTGDLARELPNGEYDFVGRSDLQVKVNGYRIELGEIAVALRAHPSVTDAAVKLYTDGDRTSLIAYFTSAGPVPQREELHDLLGRTLPTYMLPALYVPLTEMPLTRNGKTDLDALPAPRFTRAAVDTDYTAPRNHTERTLARAWSTVLGVDEIGVDDDFFILGGDSIAALKIIVRAREAGLQVTSSHILGSRTIRRLAPTATPVARNTAVADIAEDPGVARLRELPGIADAYPLTPMQAGMVFHHQFSPESSDYHQQAVFEVPGADVDALATALQDLVDAHPVLRTRVHLDDVTAPAQVVLDDFRIPVRRLDGRDADLSQVLVADRAERFDLTAQPPLRATVIAYDDRIELVLSHHHLLLDGWSLETLTDQLGRAYAARLVGERVELPDRPYRGFQRWLATRDRRAADGFWRHHLAGLTMPTRLDLHERPTRPVEGDDGAVGELHLDIEGDLLTDVRGTARTAGLTVSTLAHGAWSLLLSVYTGSREVVFGSTVAGRPAELPGVEDTLGLFINSLPVRVAVPPEQAFRPWLRTLQDRLAEVREYGYAALTDIVAASALPAGTQLFDTIVIPQTPAPVGSHGVRLREVHERTGYPLILMVEESSERIRLSLRYQHRRLSGPTVRRIAGHLRTLVTVFAQDPDRRLGDLRVLDAIEFDAIVHGFNAEADHDPTDGATIHALIEQQVARTPDALAATFRDERLTFRDLNERANRLARHLRGRGVRRETLVGVALDRSLDLLVTLLAVLKAGGAYVPLAADNPPERLRVITEDAGLRLVVTRADLERDRDTIDAQDGGDLDLPSCPHQLAYVIYTSGSSGRPKGVACHHQGLVNYLRFCARRYAFRQGGGAPVFSSFGFDMIVPNLYTPLLLGQPVHLLPEGLDPAELAAELVRLSPFSFIKLTPGHLELLTQQLAPAEAVRLAGVLAVGADAFPAHALERWHALAPGTDVINEYGPTEASVANSVYDAVAPVSTDLLPIGKPIPGTSMYVLDEQLNPVPVGVSGEIYIGGVCPARGYLNLPERTAERFLPDEFSPVPGARMYRTGDRGYWLPDGNLQFQQRVDDQVKIRGYRVETGEIEQHLVRHPGVDAAVVVARPDQQGRKHLVAYVVGPVSGAAELRAFLARSLPEYLVPAIYQSIPAVPLDANGKVDRRALPDPEYADRRQERPYAAPRDAVERTLAEVWQRTLRVDRVGIHDNYFELGGDSIMTIQIIAAARVTGLVVTPRDIFQHPTVAHLATVARPLTAKPGGRGAEVHDTGGEIPLTPIQTWFLDHDLAHAHHYNQSILLETPVDDVGTLAGGLRAVVQRHPALRARFIRTANGWRQHIAGHEDAVLLETAADLDEAGMAQKADRIQGSLDLADGPLLRAVLFTGADRPSRLLIVVHHLAVDTVSWRFIIEDLAAACAGAPLPAPSANPVTWARALHSRATDPTVVEQWSLWCRPAGTPLPADHELGPDVVGSAAAVRVELDERRTGMLLTRAPAAFRVQVEDIMLTALALTLRQWAGGLVPVDVERHGRDHPIDGVDLSRSVGWHTTVVPFAPQLPHGDLGGALLAAKNHLRAMPTDGFDHGLLRHLGTDARLAPLRRQGDAEVVFNYHGRSSPPQAGRWRAVASAFGADRARDQRRTHPVEIEAEVRDGRLLVEWTYPTSRLAEASVRDVAQRFVDRVVALSEYCVANPGGYTPSDFPLANLTDDELRELTADAPAVEDIYPLTPTQAGMLFHNLLRPGEGVYIDQQTLRLDGTVDLALFERAWIEAAGRHAILRTTVSWQTTAEPVQIVWRRPALPVSVSDTAPVEVHGFADGELPWRVVLAPSGSSAVAVFTYHHLLLDGWSVSLLLRDVLTVYEAMLAGRVPQLAPAVAFSRYVGWLASLDTAAAGEYWAAQLHDVVTPTPLPCAPADGGTGSDYATVELSAEHSHAVHDSAMTRQLTLASMANAAWSVVLAEATGGHDLVFGCTVSGRSPHLPGVEAIVGPTLNTLPLRVRVRPGELLSGLCARVQEQLLQMREYESTPLVNIQAHSGIPRGTPMFASIVVVETLPATITAGPVSLTLVDGVESAGYPLVLNVVDGECIRVELLYERNRCDSASVAGLARRFTEVLTGMADDDSAVPALPEVAHA
ncbi:non-ribosomal peptide synthetase [Micromonospora echinofusca]|uniref:Amino acid adenylation domain-containing protein n=1 Tax=Micromonospora echinofusca TaxID=47858 RepID=A0ABS3VIY6_MICEH|nr:non-ribosomal peptide synthetase [Micromonospora echinofusca]MBO4204433.1 amino acid adenylation domain-containing protein [Micromonospora echinofusca]